MRVMVAMSGGVDSSVAAAELIREGHEVVGVTMRLWGGESDTGCCSVSDVDDARRVAQQLEIDHVVFNFTEDFNTHVVEPYVHAHQVGITPNPCIECNRHLKFDRLAERARLLGFDAVATGHHAQVIHTDDGAIRLARGADFAKDQSYVLYTVDQEELTRTMFPVGHMTKAQVRDRAIELGLKTASKPDSQDVCFISRAGGRETFLGDRIPFRSAPVIDDQGNAAGNVAAIELVTIGQRRGLGLPGGGPKKFVVDVEINTDQPRVVVGPQEMLYRDSEVVGDLVWSALAPTSLSSDGESVLVQCSAHGEAQPAIIKWLGTSGDSQVTVNWYAPQRRIATGQSAVFYDPTNSWVIGGGITACSKFS